MLYEKNIVSKISLKSGNHQNLTDLDSFLTKCKDPPNETVLLKQMHIKVKGTTVC